MQDSDQSLSAEYHIHANKRRRMGERVVVAVKIEGDDKKQHRNEGPPPDRWSWRKYGQKPIKGSPYPRGYYRCSTSKGCSAKKRVERCKTDASMLIITYTSTHNHPDPTPSLPTKLATSVSQLTESLPASTNQEQELETSPEEIRTKTQTTDSEGQTQIQYPQSPDDSSSDQALVNLEENPNEEILQTSSVLDPKRFGCEASLLKSEENDFFDELEELPTSSFFTAFMKGGFCEEGIAVNLS